MRSNKGFTLVEVMVALVIAALGLTAIAVSLQQHADTSRKLRDQTLALFIASNAIAEIRLEGGFPDVGRSTDEVTFANREWIVVTVIQESGIEGLRRTDVSVAEKDNPDRNLRTVAGFVSRLPTLPAATIPGYASLDTVSGEES
ncbi:MAG: type II secretion system minor pseudopilin GspI [Woeseiaceae bacterium]